MTEINQPPNLKLNTAQYQAVQADQGPVLVIAGAGTGKTALLVEKYCHYFENLKYSTDEILVLAFNEKAAAEIQERLDLRLPYGATERYVQTYHAWCQRLLQSHPIETGLKSDFKVLDQTAQWMCLYRSVKKLSDQDQLPELAPAGKIERHLNALIAYISSLKDAMINPKDYKLWIKTWKKNKRAQKLFFPDWKDLSPVEVSEAQAQYQEIAKIYQAYEQQLASDNAIDFGGLLLTTINLLQTRSRLRKKYQTQFRAIMVDEFQDTNSAQYALLRLLVPANSKSALTVVGDDDQSIYGFRGAAIKNILSFHRDYPKAQVITLTENYRSGQKILDAAHAMVQNNTEERLDGTIINSSQNQKKSTQKIIKKLLAQRQALPIKSKAKASTVFVGEISAHWFNTQDSEIAWIVKKITEYLKSSPEVQAKDIAILCRSHDTAEPIANQLKALGFPVHWSGAGGLYTRAIVLDLISGLEVLAQWHNSPALWRVMHWPIPEWQISPNGIMTISELAKRKGLSYWECLTIAELNPVDRLAADKILSVFTYLHTHSQRQPVTQALISLMQKSGYLSALMNETESVTKSESVRDLELFFRRLANFVSNSRNNQVKFFLEDFHLELLAAGEGDRPFDPNDGPDAIAVITVHAAKGLEWPMVFIPGLIDRKFPSSYRQHDWVKPELDFQSQKKTKFSLFNTKFNPKDSHLREERRLMYVAMTRARDCLYLTGAENYGGQQKRRPSIFIAETKIPMHTETVEALPDFLHQLNTALNQKPLTSLGSQPKIPITVTEPKSFSFTQITDYEKCPLKYQYKYLWKIPTSGNWTMSFGSSLHKTLELFFLLNSERLKKINSKKNPNPKKLVLVSLKELFKIYEQNWLDDWYPDLQTAAKYKAKGKVALKYFYTEYLKHPDLTLAMEKSFAFNLNGINLKGKIDRIAQGPNNTWIIYDFKTGQPKNLEQLKQDKMLDQLFIYALAAKYEFKQETSDLIFYFLEAGGKKVSITPTEKALAKTEERIIKAVTGIKAKNFTPTPSPRICRQCEFFSICPHREV